MSGACDSLVLVGYRGAGKTTVGRLLARRLGLELVDTDELVEARSGASVAELFASRGERGFRALETAVLRELAPSAPAVVAAGGGAVLEPESRAELARLGPAAWLVARPEVLAARIAGSGRPSLTGRPPEQEVAEVLSRREPAYRAAARWVVRTDGRTADEVCDELEHLWRGPQGHDLR